MNELAWRSQLRDLRQPQPPRRDLWDAIDCALDDTAPEVAGSDRSTSSRPAPPRRRWLAAACIIAASLLLGGTGWRLLHAPAPAIALAPEVSPNWKPADPRLAGAAIELSAARMELQQALRQAPDSAALQRLLVRTERQQSRLHLLANDAG
ncbi:MAG: hypothetical protein OQK79_03365 [Rhodanobacter sp.]|jgi:hypothetical protein|nr:hypothetical protein [Rhodanobacter sp.]